MMQKETGPPRNIGMIAWIAAWSQDQDIEMMQLIVENVGEMQEPTKGDIAIFIIGMGAIILCVISCMKLRLLAKTSSTENAQGGFVCFVTKRISTMGDRQFQNPIKCHYT